MTEPIEVVAEVIETPSKELQVTYSQAVISDNLAAIEAYIDEQLKPYADTAINPSDEKAVKVGRTCMSDLNKLKEPIEAERKRIKREYEAPLKAFEARVKQITGKIDTARAGLKTQVDEADRLFVARRTKLLHEEFDGCVGELAGLLAFEKILDSKWLNRSTTETKALGSMQDAVVDVVGKYQTLVSSGLRHKDECVKLFCETLDLTKALALDGELVEKERKLAEFKAKQAEIEQANAERMQQPAPESVPIPQAIQEQPPEQQVPAEAPVFTWHLSIHFNGTKALATRLAEALKALGITGGKLENLGVIENG